MLRKTLFLLIFTLKPIICFSQNYFAKNLTNYDNCFYGKVIKSKISHRELFEKKGCITPDTLEIEFIKNIKGDYSSIEKNIEIPYDHANFRCRPSGTGRIYNENKKYLFFFNDFEKIKGNYDFGYHEIKPLNEKKELKLINNYLNVNSKPETVDWAIDYASEIDYRRGLKELFQHKYKDVKFYTEVCNFGGKICNCENSYELNSKQLKKLKEAYLKQSKFTVFDICVLTELNDYKDKELLKATIKKFKNVDDKKLGLIKKPLIKLTTKFSNDPKLIEISERIKTFNYTDYRYGRKEFQLLVREYIDQFIKQ